MHATRASTRLQPLPLVRARPAPAPAGKAGDAAAADGVDRALGYLESREWSRAFEALVPLADAGECEAARLALLMRAHGSRLFGHTFPATPLQREHWLAAARPPFEAE